MGNDRGGHYDLVLDHGYESGQVPDNISTDAWWILAVIRLGQPLSFSRAKMDSITKDLTSGAMLRAAKPLVISDDCLNLQVSATKGNHKQMLMATLKSTDVNYLVEILPGDWVMSWICNNRSDFESLLTKIDKGQPCNGFKDGLKFVGRVSSLRKIVHVDENSGHKTSNYNLACTGFEELDTMFYYDNSLASKQVLEQDIGQWQTQLGVEVQKLFGFDAATRIKKNNVNILIPKLLDLIVGHGPTITTNPDVVVNGGKTLNAHGQPNATSAEAPYSYMIPVMVGQLLGRNQPDPTRHVLAYSDILELLQGVQSYSNKSGYRMFVPDLGPDSAPNRRVCTNDMLGTFLAYMPDFANKPLWSIFQQYLNPTVNELYTCLRVNPEGSVMPTVVMRQIPFTTDAFQQTGSLGPNEEGPLLNQDDSRDVAVTRFLDLPRWYLPSQLLVGSLDIGRSDATRTNMVHVYGTSSYQSNAISIQEQIVNNPPVFDHLDIMRSGIRPYMATVECWVEDTVGTTPRTWINLVADWTIGSHLTLNGTVTCYGVQSPICVGDNLQFEEVIFQIEGLTHSCSIDPMSGRKGWRTSMNLTNGMRWSGDQKNNTADNSVDAAHQFPIYVGFEPDDLTDNDPGLSLEGRRTTGGSSDAPSTQDKQAPTASQLNPNDQSKTGAPSPFTGNHSGTGSTPPYQGGR